MRMTTMFGFSWVLGCHQQQMTFLAASLALVDSQLY